MHPANCNMAQFKIYKSSAGSGKTFTLVKEYLGIVLKNPSKYRNILALTFTNKAAGEMKARILTELADLASGANSPMKSILINEFGIDGSRIARIAAEVQGNILHDYANFAVRTIDSFTHKLIRSFAKDLELPGRFEIEMDTKLILQRNIDQLMDSIGRDEYVTDILVRFVEEKLRDQDGWRIESNLNAVGKELFLENSKPFVQAFSNFDRDRFPEFIDMLRESKRAFPEKMNALAEKGLKIIANYDCAPEDFMYGKAGVVNILDKIQQANKPQEFKTPLEGRNWRNSAVEDNWFKKGSEHPRAVAALDSGLRQVVQEIQALFENDFTDYVTAWHAFQNVHSLAVLQQIEDLIEEYKSQFNLIHITDFQPKIEQFMKNEAPEYIYWRLGERYQHFMLDEFQDTSVLQWMNLSPLVENLQAGGSGDEGSLLIVGDTKQAIYRWRGGETGLMEVLVPNKLQISPLVLDANYRSKEYVVDFNNRFFESAIDILGKDDPEIGLIYNAFSQKVRPGNEAEGFVRVELLQHEQYKFPEVARERCLELIQSIVEQGYSYKDIAILTRNNTNGSKIAELLAQHEIRVISSESILLSKAPVVSFLVSCFKFLFDPMDQIARAELLNYFFQYLHSDIELNVDPNRKIRELLKDEKPIQAMYEVLPREFKSLSYQTDRLSVYEMAEETVRIFGLQEVAPAFVQHFLDVVLEFSEKRKPDIGAFLDYWEEKKDSFSVIVPEGDNAIEILTIHKSKGLEYPIVIIPEADWETTPRTNSTIWANSGEVFGDFPDTHLVAYQDGLESSSFGETYLEERRKAIIDNLNLLYVAFTRAKNRLYVLAPMMPKSAAKAKGPEEIKNVGALIRRVLDTPSFQGMDTEIYETGFAIPSNKTTEPNRAHKPPHLISAPWRHRIRIDRKFRKYWEGETEGPNGLAPLMSTLFRNLSDSSQLEAGLRKIDEDGLANDLAILELRELAQNLLSDPQIADWFSADQTYRQNMKFLFGQAEPLVIDRIVMRENHNILILILDETREKIDQKGLKSCLEFLQETENQTAEAWILKFPKAELVPFI